MYFILASTEEGRLIPVVAENVGPYASLQEALDAWPGFHEASEDEYTAYVNYWDQQLGREWVSPNKVTHIVPPAGPCATCGQGRHETSEAERPN